MTVLVKAAFAAMILAMPVSASPIVFNGSFESGVPGDTKGLNNGVKFSNLTNGKGANWDRYAQLDGWRTLSGSGIEIQTAHTVGMKPSDGGHYVELDSNSNSSMGQFIKLAKGRYTLTFDYAPRTGDANTNGISYAIGGLTFGKVTGPDKATGTGVGHWTTIGSDFVVKKEGKYLLAFEATGKSDSYGGFVDNVAVSVSAVPLPATALLLGTALAGVGAIRRRRKAA